MGNAKNIPPGDGLFLPFQKRWILDTSRLKLMEKSRQIGISWSSAYGIVRRMAQKGGKLDSWVSSRDDLQARLFLEDCKTFASVLEVAAQDMGSEILDAEGSTSYNLRFASGTVIHSMSSNPDAQAGKRGSRLLDEFALHKNPRKLYSIAYPGITWGGQLEIVSTHRGSANFFNELIRDIREKGNPRGFSLHRVTLEDALNEGFLYKLQQKLPPDDPRQEMDEADYFDFIKSGCADNESFLQEYCCVPADDNSAFLSYDLIASCEYPATVDDSLMEEAFNLSDLKECKSLYAGVDVARKKDFTVIWINCYEGLRHLTKRIITLKNMTFTDQEKILYSVLELPNLRRCCIDATGIGEQFAERAAERFGSYRVEGVKFTPQSKSDMAYPVRMAFEDGNILIPFDKHLRADLRSIRKETTASGNIRFAADHSENGHADRFWGCALALRAAASDGDGECHLMPAIKDDEKNNYMRSHRRVANDLLENCRKISFRR